MSVLSMEPTCRASRAVPAPGDRSSIALIGIGCAAGLAVEHPVVLRGAQNPLHVVLRFRERNVVDEFVLVEARALGPPSHDAVLAGVVAGKRVVRLRRTARPAPRSRVVPSRMLVSALVSVDVLKRVMPSVRARRRPVAGTICIRPHALADERMLRVEGRFLRDERGDQIRVEIVRGAEYLRIQSQ